jgi:hypothetical protein
MRFFFILGMEVLLGEGWEELGLKQKEAREVDDMQEVDSFLEVLELLLRDLERVRLRIESLAFWVLVELVNVLLHYSSFERVLERKPWVLLLKEARKENLVLESQSLLIAEIQLVR